MGFSPFPSPPVRTTGSIFRDFSPCPGTVPPSLCLFPPLCTDISPAFSSQFMKVLSMSPAPPCGTSLWGRMMAREGESRVLRGTRYTCLKTAGSGRCSVPESTEHLCITPNNADLLPQVLLWQLRTPGQLSWCCLSPLWGHLGTPEAHLVTPLLQRWGRSHRELFFSRVEEPSAIEVTEGLVPLAAHLPGAEELQENPPLPNEGARGSCAAGKMCCPLPHGGVTLSQRC